MSFASRKRYHVCYNQRSVPNQYLNFTYNHMTIFWCRIHLWFRWMGVCTQSRWRHSVTMPSQDGGYVLLWQRYDNNKMADMCYYGNVILHLLQYSHRLNLFNFFLIWNLNSNWSSDTSPCRLFLLSFGLFITTDNNKKFHIKITRRGNIDLQISVIASVEHFGKQRAD